MHSKLAESELKVFLREFGNSTTYLPIAIGKWRVFFKVVCIDWETKICVFNTLLRQNKLLGNLQLAGCGFLQFSKFLNLSFTKFLNKKLLFLINQESFILFVYIDFGLDLGWARPAHPGLWTRTVKCTANNLKWDSVFSKKK